MKFILQQSKENKKSRVDFQSRIKNMEKELSNSTSIVIPGARFHRIDRNLFLQVDSLTCFNNEYAIVSFVLTDGTTVEASSSNFLTIAMKNIIRKVKVNERVFIENIKVLAPDNSLRKIPAMSIIVEDK